MKTWGGPASSCQRPNFLLFITDQQRADLMGCMGSPWGLTPHLDALADQAIVFDECHVATPLCQPNRASLMTGRLPSAHGVRSNGRELSLAEQTFVEVLAGAGYRTALVGKAHLQNITEVQPPWPQPAERAGVEARRPHPGRHGQERAGAWARNPDAELDLPYYGFDEVRLCIGHADVQQGHWRRWLRQQSPQAEGWIGPEHALPTPDWALAALGQAWRTRLPEALHPTRYIASQACEMLEAFAAAGQPFFLQCSFPDPHHPFTPPGRFWDLVRPQDVGLPASFDAALTDPPPPVGWLKSQRLAEPTLKPGHGVFACTAREAREAWALNLGSMAFIDEAIGDVCARLRALGLDDDTVIIFTSDHGDLLGDRGLMFKGGLHYRPLTRVPLLWRETVDARTPVRRHDLAQTIDLASTVLARAGVGPVNGLQGRSLLDTAAEPAGLLIEEEGQRRDFGLDRRIRMRSWLTRRHRLTVWDGQPWGELVDRQEDPMELRNLWADPGHARCRAELMEQMARAMMAAADTSPYPQASA
jgi:arylsulfatase A-like enzyme